MTWTEIVRRRRSAEVVVPIGCPTMSSECLWRAIVAVVRSNLLRIAQSARAWTTSYDGTCGGLSTADFERSGPMLRARVNDVRGVTAKTDEDRDASNAVSPTSGGLVIGNS
jgi:hypothetical protein